jgi:hypothetical protein
MIVLPEFGLLKRQPKVPNVARVLLRRDVTNEYGTPITYTVHESRNGKDWWISASLDGMRMSDTLHTSVRKNAEAWIRAVETGHIQIGEQKPKSQLDRELNEALSKRKR